MSRGVTAVKVEAGDRVRLLVPMTTAGDVDVPAGIVGTVVAIEPEKHWPFRVHFEGYSTTVTDGNWLLRADEIEVVR